MMNKIRLTSILIVTIVMACNVDENQGSDKKDIQNRISKRVSRTQESQNTKKSRKDAGVVPTLCNEVPVTREQCLRFGVPEEVDCVGNRTIGKEANASCCKETKWGLTDERRAAICSFASRYYEDDPRLAIECLSIACSLQKSAWYCNLLNCYSGKGPCKKDKEFRYGRSTGKGTEK
jgi:hypothetical protein